jgi:ABC-type transporter Mla maintaining outer membrane lipid asymmetry permease subunit MlaE
MEEIAARGARYARRRVADWFAEVGRITLMVGEAARAFVPALRSFRLIVDQMNTIGVGSLWLVTVVSLFTGGVGAGQAGEPF